jgi:type III secretion protein L
MTRAILKGSENASLEDVVPLELAERRLKTRQTIADDSTVLSPEDPNAILHEKIAQLTTERDTLAAQIERLQLEYKGQFDKAYEDGRTKGLSEAEDDQAHYQAIFAGNCKSAMTQLSQSLDNIEALAASLSLAAVKRIVGDDAERKELVSLLLGNAKDALTRESVKRWRVSSQDFSDEEALKKLSEELSNNGTIIVEADSRLTSGACVADLELGGIDLGIDTQLEQFALFCDSIMNQRSST